MESRKANLNIYLVPFAGYGHCIPFLQLGRRLHTASTLPVSVTLCVPSDVLAELRTRGVLTPEDEEKVLRILEVDSLSLKAPKTASTPQTLAQSMMQQETTRGMTSGPPRNIMHGLQTKLAMIFPGIKGFLGTLGRDADLVVIDYYISPAADALQEQGIPYMVFNTGAPLMATSLLTITEATPTEAAADWPTLPSFRNSSPIQVEFKEMTLERKVILTKSSGFILNSFFGLADDLVKEVAGNEKYGLSGLDVFQVGPLLPEEEGDGASAKDEQAEKILAWLDQAPPRSVIYISFGTVATPSPPQLLALSTALLTLSTQRNLKILWSVPPSHHTFLHPSIPSSPSFLMVSWTPQRRVLAHRSTGLFMSHCGWNSTLESLSCGVPLVGWPLFSDQYLNAQWIEDEGLGVMVKGTGLMGPRVRVVPEDEIVGIVGRMFDEHGTFSKTADAWKRKIGAALEKPSGNVHSELKRLLGKTAPYS